jgi:hypothetical protein
MSKVTLDKATLAKLMSNGGQVEVYDESGNVVGYFRTRADKELYEKLEIPFTEEELRRAEEEPGGRTLAEIWADLEKRP